MVFVDNKRNDYKTQYVENWVDFNVHTTSPSAKDDLGFSEQNKDLIFGNLNPMEVMVSRKLINQTGFAEGFGLLHTANYLRRVLMGIANTSRAKWGKEREMVVTQIQKSQADYNENMGKKQPFRVFGSSQERKNG